MFWINILPVFSSKSPTLKKETKSSYEASVNFYQTARRHIRRDGILSNEHPEDLNV